MKKLGLIVLTVMSFNLFADDSVSLGEFKLSTFRKSHLEASFELSNVNRPYVKVREERRSVHRSARFVTVATYDLKVEGLFIDPVTRELKYKGIDGDYVCGKYKRVPVLGVRYLEIDKNTCQFNIEYAEKKVDDGLNVRTVKVANVALNLITE